MWKQRDATLVGDIKPETGKPEYETDVAYWMQVTSSGVGFHDAIWQTAFGGTLYQIPGTGSHGCINMPLDQAGALFNSYKQLSANDIFTIEEKTYKKYSIKMRV